MISMKLVIHIFRLQSWELVLDPVWLVALSPMGAKIVMLQQTHVFSGEFKIRETRLYGFFCQLFGLLTQQLCLHSSFADSSALLTQQLCWGFEREKRESLIHYCIFLVKLRIQKKCYYLFQSKSVRCQCCRKLNLANRICLLPSIRGRFQDKTFKI